MTWSARSSSDGGMVRPSALAVLRLITQLLNVVGCETGRLPGLQRSARSVSAFELLLQLVEEPPVGALGEDFRGRGLDHPGFVEAQRVEAQRVAGIVDAPSIVWHLLHRLKRIVVARRESVIDEATRGALWLKCADVSGLQDGTQRPLGRDRMPLDEFAVSSREATEVL